MKVHDVIDLGLKVQILEISKEDSSGITRLKAELLSPYNEHRSHDVQPVVHLHMAREVVEKLSEDELLQLLRDTANRDIWSDVQAALQKLVAGD